MGPPQHVLWNVKWPYLFIMISALSAEIYEVWAEFPLIDDYGILVSSKSNRAVAL